MVSLRMFQLCLLACALTTVSAGGKDWDGRDSHWGCPGGKVIRLANEFHYFHTRGSATGCEHKKYYLWDYKGTDCEWTSDIHEILQFENYDYQYFGANFIFADKGNKDYKDFVKVNIAPCTSTDASSCGAYETSVVQKGNKHGWSWRWVTQRGAGNGDQAFANGDGYSWLQSLEPHHAYFRIKIILSSNKDYSEQHIVDRLNVWGWGCKKGTTVKVNCAGSWSAHTCSPSCDSHCQAEQYYTHSTDAKNGGTACPHANGATKLSPKTYGGSCPVHCVGSWSADTCSPSCGSSCAPTLTYTHTTLAAHGGNACPYNNGATTTGTTRYGAACPTASPTKYPTKNPTKYPTASPTASPTHYPTKYPTPYPTPSPTAYPTPYPTAYPTSEPTTYPTPYPTAYPTSEPTTYPTPYPTTYPTSAPTGILGHDICAHTTCSYSSGRTHVYTFGNTYGPAEKWHCEKSGSGCKCVCHSSLQCALRHHHTSGYKKTFEHC